MVYSCSTVFWRTEDGGLTWSAVRGAPGGDDYQKSWVNPVFPQLILLVSDQGAVVSANRGESWSNWYNQPTAAMYHVTADNAFPYRLCSGQQDSRARLVSTAGVWTGRSLFTTGIRSELRNTGRLHRIRRIPTWFTASKVTVYNRLTGQKANVGPPGGRRAAAERLELPAECAARDARFGRSLSTSGRPKIRTFFFTRPLESGRPLTPDIAGPQSAGTSRAKVGMFPRTRASTRRR